MTRFFDASAVVNAYTHQESSARMRRSLARGEVAVSRLTEVEVVSAFARLSRESAMTEVRRDAVSDAFLTDFGGWVVVDLTPEVTARARALLVRHPLRAGNAIQLASALVLESRLTRALDAFVATDKRLLDAARREGLTLDES